MFRLVRAVICIFLVSTAAQAQITTSRVKVRVTGRCDGLQNVFLVMDDHDLETLPLEKTKERCRWTADLGEKRRFSTKLSHFSLRFELGRTDCRQAVAEKKELIAELEFACCSDDPPQHVHVTTEPKMPVSYLRTVSKNPDETTRSVKCTEFGTFPKGSGRIGYAQFDDEKIDILLGIAKPKGEPGLILNDVGLHGGTVLLRRNGVVYRLIVQRAKGKTSTSTLSSNAISIDIKKLEELKFESAEFAVIK